MMSGPLADECQVIVGAIGGARVAHLQAGGTSVLVRLAADDLPCVLHWGADLGALSPADMTAAVEGLRADGDGIDPHPWLSLLPRQTAGWLGRPGLQGSHAGQAWALTYTDVTHDVRRSEAGWVLSSLARDAVAGVQVGTEVEVMAAGLVRLRASVRNLDEAPYTVDALEPCLPVPAVADELLDMGGRPGHERTPQRKPFDQGLWMRESWGGRPGHDSATLLCAGRQGFGFGTGSVWGVHLAWSGNQVLGAESSFTGWRILRGGELLTSQEVVLGRGEQYTSPWLYASWGEGLDDLSARFHTHLRASRHLRARPVILNTWEAVYFDVDTERLIELAQHAARLGVERYVLDDGWFTGRTDDTRALGDWAVDADRFPAGLEPLVEAVHGLGMEFGLWVEPEMISLDSDLARAHPEWVLATHAGPGIASRNQHVLDLSNPQAFEHVLDRLVALVEQHDIAYLKWDHNRPLLGAGRGPEHLPGIHAQTLAVYRMMAELRTRRPGLEIESCCGGGGRLDLGIMEHASRAWVSDCIDAHERHRMVRWTNLLLPLEMLGTHVGAATDHTSRRQHAMGFRAGTALWGHMGVEVDVRTLSEEDRTELARWIEAYKQFRGLVHSGRAVHGDDVDPALQLDGVVADDRGEALYRLSMLEHPARQPAGRVTLPGLDPDATYRLTVLTPGAGRPARRWPDWYAQGATHRGSALAHLGVTAPPLDVDELVYLHAVRTAP